MDAIGVRASSYGHSAYAVSYPGTGGPPVRADLGNIKEVLLNRGNRVKQPNGHPKSYEML